MRRPSLKMEARLDELFVDIVVLALAAAAPEKLKQSTGTGLRKKSQLPLHPHLRGKDMKIILQNSQAWQTQNSLTISLQMQM